VDTGAAFSILPHFSTAAPHGPLLSGPGGAAIPCWGERQLTISLGGRQFQWTFLLAAVRFPILGVDFLRHHRLLVDPANNQLVEPPAVAIPTAGSQPTPPPPVVGGVLQRIVSPPPDSSSSSSSPSSTSTPSSSTPSSPARLCPVTADKAAAAGYGPAPPPSSLEHLLAAFPEVVNSSKVLPAAVVHDVQHHIKTAGPPIAAKFRRLEGDKLEAARREFAAMEAEGIVRRSTSPWASPLHMVPKKDGTWRPCGDFRRLNLVTEPDVYPLPNMLDFADRLHGCQVFSKIDLRKGYWQVPVREEDVQKTAVATPFGLFEFLRMPFGLRNAGSSFQRMMDRVISGLPFAYVYLDDLRVASPDLPSHLQHLHEVFRRLHTFGLVISLEKCAFCVSSFEFLGHHVSAEGARPLVSYVEAVRSRPPPATVKELQTFLGLINFYRRFVPAAALTLLPLTDYLKGSKPASERLRWSPEMEAAFVAAKESLLQATWLAHPHPRALLALHVDASASHVGAALHQQEPGSSAWRPLGFFSKKLDASQVKWSAFDRELLACVASIRHFRYILEGRSFCIFTDHKPLLGALQRASDPWTARQCRHLSYVAEFTSDIRHVAGAANVAADALSRPPAEELVAAVEPASAVPDLKGIAARQATCESTQAVARSPTLHVELKEVDGVPLLCETSRGTWRPLVPAADRRDVFHAVHDVAHPGVRATRRLLGARFIWPAMMKDIAAWCRDCTSCQRAKVTKQHTASVESIDIPQRRFSHVHVDLVGPLPVAADGSTYLLTMIDRTTRWLEAVPLRDISAATCSQAFLGTWVSRFGVPSTLTSDRGTQFTSEAWRKLCEQIGTRHVTTTAYHPQANGLVERVHRQLKDALRARAAGAEWPLHLPWILLGLRAAPKEVCGLSSAEAVFGQQLVLPNTVLHVPEEQPEAFCEKLASSQPPCTVLPRTYAEVAASGLPRALREADMVYVRRAGGGGALDPVYVGPFRVLRRQEKTFVLQVGEREEKVTVDRLKPHVGTAPLQPASAPKRGRPRKLQPP